MGKRKATEQTVEKNENTLASEKTKKKKVDVAPSDDIEVSPSGPLILDETQTKQLSNIIDIFFDTNKMVFPKQSSFKSLLTRLECSPNFIDFLRNNRLKFGEELRQVVVSLMKPAIGRHHSSFKDQSEVAKLYPEEFNPSVFFVKRRVTMIYPLYYYGGLYQVNLSSGEEFMNGDDAPQKTKHQQTDMEKLIEKQLFERAFQLVDGYDTKLRGFVMGVEDVKVLDEGSIIQFETNPSLASVNIAATFVLFAPTFGTILRGTIDSVNNLTGRAICKILGLFNASVDIPENVLPELYAGQIIQFHTTAITLRQGRSLGIQGRMEATDGIVSQPTQKAKSIEEEYQFDETELPFN